MRAVNLLPKDVALQPGGRKQPPLPVLAACVGAVLVSALLAVLYLSASSKVAGLRRTLEQTQAVAAAIPAPPSESPVYSQLPQQKLTRVSALAAVLGQRVAWDRLLREVSQVVPSDVWLDSLNAQSPGYGVSTTGTSSSAVPSSLPTGFTVSGCTYSQDSVARFLARLDLVPDLTGMTLAKSATGSGSGTGSTSCPPSMFTFSLQGTVRAAGATS